MELAVLGSLRNRAFSCTGFEGGWVGLLCNYELVVGSSKFASPSPYFSPSSPRRWPARRSDKFAWSSHELSMAAGWARTRFEVVVPTALPASVGCRGVGPRRDDDHIFTLAAASSAWKRPSNCRG